MEQRPRFDSSGRFRRHEDDQAEASSPEQPESERNQFDEARARPPPIAAHDAQEAIAAQRPEASPTPSEANASARPKPEEIRTSVRRCADKRLPGLDDVRIGTEERQSHACGRSTSNPAPSTSLNGEGDRTADQRDAQRFLFLAGAVFVPTSATSGAPKPRPITGTSRCPSTRRYRSRRQHQSPRASTA